MIQTLVANKTPIKDVAQMLGVFAMIYVRDKTMAEDAKKRDTKGNFNFMRIPLF